MGKNKVINRKKKWGRINKMPLEEWALRGKKVNENKTKLLEGGGLIAPCLLI